MSFETLTSVGRRLNWCGRQYHVMRYDEYLWHCEVREVVRNKGAEGVDGMKYTELKEHLVKNGESIKEQLRARKYRPQPVRRVEIPKSDGGVRNLGVPTVTDRFIQQAIAQVLTPIYEEQFHDHSYGFRPVPRSIAEKVTSLLDVKFFSFAGFGYKMLAEAVKADLPYHISCPALLICGERDKVCSAKNYDKK